MLLRRQMPETMPMFVAIVLSLLVTTPPWEQVFGHKLPVILAILLEHPITILRMWLICKQVFMILPGPLPMGHVHRQILFGSMFLIRQYQLLKPVLTLPFVRMIPRN